MIPELTPVVDVDDSGTWPDQFAQRVHELVEQRRHLIDDPAEFPCSDLGLWEREAEVHQLLDGYLLRGYHATRLLAHETDTIRAHGLRLFDDKLGTDRLDTAVKRGYLTKDEHATLIQSMALVDNRVGQICFFPSKTTLTEDAGGLNLLLAAWGGEAIYMPHVHTDNPMNTKLRSMGIPSIVVAQLDLRSSPTTKVFPGLANAFVAAALGLTSLTVDVIHRAPVPPSHIERIFHPGDTDYPPHQDLPQE
ncbi:hypothetical protein [Amycolatopsis vastitatis]|uniref:Uncharacterized protein n=1 Tax=Amycolatopsis vastitatis TaxID=1905142 RepID=A0A229SKK1_9PSEU|nr:hypothetical protein [Amycolatopsis vastitatis]OXM59300.1 hypothetical protein CF165_48315 [Amycolatopsis vastitatis]